MSLKITIDGQTYEAEPGSMIIEVADAVGVKIPRFCYHPELSIAANCRMCLVEVSNAPRPVPACATPITDGMSVSTISQKTKDAQKAVMEFLLINHPLDCPICDQGGECELQDLAVEYGLDRSSYHEMKRVVNDFDLGPLVATDMTRCIHCTRCVRFGTEVAGDRELGANGRGEHTKIGTFLEKSLNSELSGNVIDLCPVGALTSKPNRFAGRPWEYQQKEGFLAHDSLCSHVYFNSIHNQIKRVLPRYSKEINECWLSDRDRFSYLALKSKNRLLSPFYKLNQKWNESTWDKNIDLLVQKFQKYKDVQIIAHPNHTSEENYLLNQLQKRLNPNRGVHLVKSDSHARKKFPWTLEEIESKNILIIGDFLQYEHPMMMHRVRKAQKNGKKIMIMGSLNHENSNFLSMKTHPLDYVTSLVNFLDEKINDQNFFNDQEKENLAIILTAGMMHHPNYKELIHLAEKFAQKNNTQLGILSYGNLLGTQEIEDFEFYIQDCDLVLTWGLDFEDCSVDPYVMNLFIKTQDIVMFSGFDNKNLDSKVSLKFPIAIHGEVEGTFSNCFGEQVFTEKAVAPSEEIKQGWEIIEKI
jgi:NADH-quinone oxidoreductase subunit G